MTRLFDEKKVVGLVLKSSLTTEQQNDENSFVTLSKNTYALLFNSGLFTISGSSLYGLLVHFESNNPSKYSIEFDSENSRSFHPFRAWKCVCWSHETMLSTIHQRLDLTKHFHSAGIVFHQLPTSLSPESCNFFYQDPSSDLYVPQCLSTFDPRLEVKSDFRFIFGNDDDLEEQKKRREHRLPRVFQDENKFSNKMLCDLISIGLGQSVQMAKTNPRFTIPYYQPNFDIPRGGSIQLLLPVSLSAKNGRWNPHVIVALDYISPKEDETIGYYSASNIIGLGGARFYSRIVQKLDQEWIQISANRSRSNINNNSSNNRPRRPEICPYFLRGSCQYGDSCSNSHNVNNRSMGRGFSRSNNNGRPYDLTLQGKGLFRSSAPSSFRRESNSNNYSNSNSNMNRSGGGRFSNNNNRSGRW